MHAEIKGASKWVQLQTICADRGQEGLLQVLQEDFAIDVDYWVAMNYQGMAETIDALGGLQLLVDSLGVNDLGRHVKSLLGKAWQTLEETGLQLLNGTQSLGWLLDTMAGNPTPETEELRFRDKHAGMIRSIVDKVRTSGLTAQDLVRAAHSLRGFYATNIPEEEWGRIADMAVRCLANEPMFLHVPQQIVMTKTSNGWKSIQLTESDADLVKQFALQ